MTDRERHRDEQAQWFGDNVRQNRERKEMSQGELARQMTGRGWQWHQSTVYKVEHGARRTEAFELHDLAAILGVPMDHLFWPPAEINETAMVDRSGAILRRAWEEAAVATRTLIAARAWGERTIELHGGSEYGRVREACAELESELAERTTETAAAEGARRYENPEED